MREGPLPCTSHSVVSILKGKKTKSRRVVKLGGAGIHRRYTHAWEHLGGGWVFAECPMDRRLEVGDEGMQCPYGTVGDRLWVKEAWRGPKSLDDKTAKQIAAACHSADYPAPWCPIRYEADGVTDNWDRTTFGSELGRYRAARFMPKWLSRITLELVEVRVERLHEITEEEAFAEGIASLDESSELSTRAGFAEAWDNLNEKRGYPWDLNPWVWVLGFRRLRKEQT